MRRSADALSSQRNHGFASCLNESFATESPESGRKNRAVRHARASTFATCECVHRPPRRAGTFRTFKPAAMALALDAPPACSSRMTGNTLAANWSAAAVAAFLPSVAASTIRGLPSFWPRGLAACKAARPFGNHFAFMLGNGRQNVDGQFVERHAALHDRGDERDIAGQAVKLRDDQRGALPPAGFQGLFQLRPIRPLAGLDFGVFRDQLPAAAVKVVTALRWASRPRPLLPCRSVLTR